MASYAPNFTFKANLYKLQSKYGSSEVSLVRERR